MLPEHVQGLRLPVSKPGFTTRLLSARAWVAPVASETMAAISVAANNAAKARRRVLAQVKAHLSRGEFGQWSKPRGLCSKWCRPEGVSRV
ncbi:hypothetical protein GCM10009839_56860 [Catenulispora yoronensis]|uniref:Uncharacterized protein n=1 Tax=Catenulispora yoronensis TaxID=450799 RepID=A0ABP5GFB3_9ACTN